MRLANLADLAILGHWNTLPHIQFARGNNDFNQENEEDKWLGEQLKNPSQFVQIYIATLEDLPIGCVQIIDPFFEESHYWGETAPNQKALDIWIGETDYLNKGFGTKMMNQALEICFANHLIANVLIDPLVVNVRAIKFYKKIGFEFVENRYFDADYCAVHQLSFKRWQELNFKNQE